MCHPPTVSYNYLDADLASITTLVGATFQSKTLDSVIEYSYTPFGQIETIAQSGPNATSKVVKYSYDLAGWTTQIERSEPPPPSGNPPTVPAFASFLTTTYSYRDAQGKKTTRIQSMSHTAPNSNLASSSLLASYSLGWDPGGRLVSMTTTADQGVAYTYDRNDQLKSATYQKPAYANLNFSYDDNGNRTGGGNTPGPDNRQASDGVSDFAYDLDGNMIRRTDKTTGAVIEYAWDLRNRLTDVTFKSSASGPITKSVHTTYDALNRRIGKSVDSDGNGTLDQVDWYANRGLRTDRENAGDEVMLRMNASGNVTSRYLHGASVDEILAEENIAANGTRDVLWPLADQQGSVRDIARRGADGRATTVAHIMYGPFGEKIAETDTAIAHLYGYTGREYDPETGLQYNRARYYDPKLGRFISQDPMSFGAGDANLYRYVGNHGTHSTDPSGQIEPPEARTSTTAATRVVSGTDGSVRHINPKIDEGVLRQIEADKTRDGNKIILDTMHLPGNPTKHGRKSLDPIGVSEQLNAERLISTDNVENEIATAISQNIVEGVILSGAQQLILHGKLRDLYHVGDKQIGEAAREFVRNGMAPKDAAEWRVAQTNELKVRIRAQGNPIIDIYAKWRAQKPGALPDLPTMEDLVSKYKSKGLTDNEIYKRIINRQPDTGVDKLAVRLKIAGRAMLILDVGLAAREVVVAPTWQEKMRTFTIEAARIGAGLAGSAGGARVGVSFGRVGGPWGAVAGGVGGAVFGGVSASSLAQAAIRELVYSLFPVSTAELEVIDGTQQ